MNIRVLRTNTMIHIALYIGFVLSIVNIQSLYCEQARIIHEAIEAVVSGPENWHHCSLIGLSYGKLHIYMN